MKKRRMQEDLKIGLLVRFLFLRTMKKKTAKTRNRKKEQKRT